MTVRANPGSSIERLLRGLAFHFAGARFLLRTRALWWFAFFPILLSGVALLAATVLLWNFAGEIFQALTSWMPVLDVEYWFEWISFCGLVIPGAQLIAPIVMAGVVILFLPIEYASYALERRQLAFRERRRWALAHKLEMLGFGGGAFLLCLVPGLNLCAMPVLVVSATLLVVHLSRSPLADLAQ